MKTRNAAKVFPDPVGAEMSVAFPATIEGQPAICGSVGVPNRPKNQSRISGCAHSNPRTPSCGSSCGSLLITNLNYRRFVKVVLCVRRRTGSHPVLRDGRG